MYRALVTAKESTVRSPTSAATTAVVTPQQPKPLASQSKPLASGPAAHNRRRRHVFGLTAAGSYVSHTLRPPAPPATIIRQTWPGRAFHHRSLVTSRSRHPTQASSLPDNTPEPRHLDPAPGPPSPPEPPRPRPPASFPRPRGHRSSKTSLGYISTPLIWQGRKRPTGRRRPTSTRAPPRPVVHITKPAQPTELKSTARPKNTTQTRGLKHTPGFKNATHMLEDATNTTLRLHASAQPTSRPNVSHQPIYNKEIPTTTQDSKLLPESGVPILSQESSPWQRRDEALDTKESSSAVGPSSSSLLSSSSVLSNRKNKPVAPQLSLQSISGGENHTVALGNWTNPLEPLGDEYSSGSEPFVYDLSEFTGDGGAFGLYEFDAAYTLDEPATIPPAFINPDTTNEQSFNRSDPHAALLSVSEAAIEHFHNDSESLAGGSAAGGELSLTHSQDRLLAETLTFISRSQIPTLTVSQTLTVAQTHDRGLNNTHSSGQKQALTQHLQTFQPTPSLLIPPLSSLLFIQPTPSLPMVQLSSSAFPTVEIFPKQIYSSSVPKTEDMSQIAYSSLSLNPLDSVYESDITGSELAVAKSRMINNLYTSSDLQLQSSVHLILHSTFSSSSPVFPQTSSSYMFAFPLDISGYSSTTLPPLIPLSPSLPLLSASTSFASSHAFTSASSSVSSVTLQITTSPPFYSSNTLAPLSSSPSLWSTTIRLPSRFLPPSFQQAETTTDGVVESAHVSESDGVSGNFQPSVLSFLSLSLNLQRDFVVTRVDTASSMSLPLFSKAPTEPQMSVVDGALLPEYHLLSESLGSRLPYSESNQPLDSQSGPFVHSIFLDSSSSQIEPTPSGLSLENVASSSVVLTPDLPPQVQPAPSQLELLDPELGSSVVLWPSSQAASLSVGQFLVHSDQRDLSDLYTLPDESRPGSHSGIVFTSLPEAVIWASERTPALLQENIDRTQRLYSASLSSISSLSSDPFLSTWSPCSHHLGNLSLTLSSEALPAAAVVEEQTALPSSSPFLNPVVESSHLGAHTSSSGSQDLTFNRDPWRLQHTISRLHTDSQVNTNANSRHSQALAGHGDAFYHPTSPLLFPSVMAPTQTLGLHSSSSAQLGTATPQHASGLDYTLHSGLTHPNTEHPGRLIHTHSSPHTQMHTHSGAQLNVSQRQTTQNVFGGLQQESSHLISFAPTPTLLSPSILPSLSLPATLAPPFLSLQLSLMNPTIPPYITASSLSLSSLITSSLSPLLPGWVALPAVSASMEEAEIGSLLPNWLSAGFQQPTTTQSPMDNHLQSFQSIQSTESLQQSVTVSQSPPLHQASTLPDDKLKPSHSKPFVSAEEYDKDEVLQQLANNSQTADASRFDDDPVLSLEASNNLTAAGKLSHLSALFNPADVVPKIHIVDEQASPSAGGTNDNITLDVMLNAHQPNESLNAEAALNTQSFPVKMQTTTQYTGAPVIQNPLHASGLNIPSSPPASRSPTVSSIDAPGQGFISGFEDNHTANTAGLKYLSMSNVTTVITLKDSPSVPVELTNATKAKNALIIQNGSMEAPHGKMTGSEQMPDLSANLTVSKPSLNTSPSVSNHSGSQDAGVSVNGGDVKDVHLSPTQPVAVNAHHFITTKNSSPAAPFRAVSMSAGSGGGLKKFTVHPTPGSPTVDSAPKPALPCQCKQRFHFTCLCGLSSGNSMSCSNKKL